MVDVCQWEGSSIGGRRAMQFRLARLANDKLEMELPLSLKVKLAAGLPSSLCASFFSFQLRLRPPARAHNYIVSQVIKSWRVSLWYLLQATQNSSSSTSRPQDRHVFTGTPVSELSTARPNS